MAVAFAFVHRVLMSLLLAVTEPEEEQPKLSGQSAIALESNISV